MAMLLLAQAAIPARFEVATVDHGLRPEAAEECALVERACAARGVPCAVLKVQVGGGNLQASAREARYAALAQWALRKNLAAIATAHHADDQAETLLMRLNRGCGVAGLAGVRERGVVRTAEGEVPLIRPLLRFRRGELGAIVASADGLHVVHDPSNEDDRFDRARLRKALGAADWIDPLALARSAGHLAEAEDALAAFAATLWATRVRRDGDAFTLDPPAPRMMRLRIVERIIGELGGDPRGGDVARLVDRLEQGDGGNVGGVLATAANGRWLFRSEPPRR